MTPDQLHRIENLFHAALSRPVQDRSAFLDQACHQDPLLRQEIESLLQADDASTSLMNSPALNEYAQLMPDDVGAEMIDHHIGGFQIVRVLASGGMGVVYEALQQDPKRSVALKLMKLGLSSPAASRRFQYESQILAKLQHPGIAQVYEAGVHRDGTSDTPYFAMEFVPDARTIIQYADQHNFNVKQRLDLFNRVCDAVDHGHQRGIIHRDLKPGNILVNPSGQPKVIDFGVARSTNADLAVNTMQTNLGQLVGTLQYMSPEQCGADPHDLDMRSDVYSLGVVLYELLCGQLPYDLTKTAISEASRIIKQTPLKRLSAVNRTLRGDIETVIAKALEKERTRRYQSVADFRQDIERHLNREPIKARPPSPIYLTTMFAKRNKTLVIAAAATMLSLMAAVVLSTSFALEAEQQRQRAVQERQIAQQREATARRYLYDARMSLAQQAWQRGHVARVMQLLNLQRPAPGEPDIRSFKWHYLWALCHSDQLTLNPFVQHVYSIAISPDGKMAAASGKPGHLIKLWRLPEWEQGATLEGHSREVVAIAFSPNGKTLASASHDATIKLWDVTLGQQIATWSGHKGRENAIAFSPDGMTLASGGQDAAVRIWDVDSGRIKVTLKGHLRGVEALAFSPGGECLATGSSDHTVKLWDPASHQLKITLGPHKDSVRSVAFSPDGKTLATGMFDEPQVNLWNTAAGQPVASLVDHTGGVHALAFSPDGESLATGGADDIVKLWDLRTGAVNTQFKGHTHRVLSLAFFPDGNTLVSGSLDARIKIWNVPAGQEHLTLNCQTERVCAVAVSSDGRTLASATARGTVTLWAMATAKTQATFQAHTDRTYALAFSPDDKTLATASWDGTVKLWDVATAAHRQTIQEGCQVRSIAFAPDGKTLAVGRYDQAVMLWDLAHGREKDLLKGHQDNVYAVTFSPDGRTLASAGRDQTVKLWHLNTSREPTSLNHRASISGLAFTPEGNTLATGGSDNLVKLWEVSDGRQKTTLQGHAAGINAVAFSPDGRLLASAAEDNTVRLWDPATGQEEITLNGHRGRVMSLAFSPNGKKLATASFDRTIKLWTLPTPK